MPDSIYSEIPDTAMQVACYAADISLRVYIEDVKSLVSKHVLAELSPLLEGDCDRHARRVAIERHNALSRWLDEDYPLSYSPNILSYLMRALLDTPEGDYRLVPSTLGGKPVSFFVELIVKHCKESESRRKPPFISGGNFLSVVRVAYEEMERGAALSGLKGDEVPNSIVQAFTHVVERKKINHVPWSANPTGRAGNPYTTITPTVWLNLGAKPTPTSSRVPSFLSRDRSSHTLAVMSSEDIQMKDARGEWSAMEVKLNSFQSVQHKSELPSECNILNASLGGNEDYVIAAYQYVQTSFKPSKPIHLLALIAAIACAGLLPNIFHPQFTRGSYPTETSGYPSFIRNMDWTTKPRKGVNQPAPFLVMITTFIISLNDPDSPLTSRLQMDGGDLTNWFNKHCKHPHHLPSSPSHFDSKLRKESTPSCCVAWD
jgi:hypothetical protein